MELQVALLSILLASIPSHIHRTSHAPTAHPPPPIAGEGLCCSIADEAGSLSTRIKLGQQENSEKKGKRG